MPSSKEAAATDAMGWALQSCKCHRGVSCRLLPRASGNQQTEIHRAVPCPPHAPGMSDSLGAFPPPRPHCHVPSVLKHLTWAVTPLPPWAACSNTSPPVLRKNVP